MASGEAIKLSLRVRHPSIRACELVKRVGLTPRVARDKGTKTLIVGGKVRTNDHTYCCFPIRVASIQDAPKALAKGVAILEREEEFWTEFLSTGGSIEYFVGVFVDSHIGLTVSRDLAARMAKWKIDLALDIYGPDKDIEKKKKLREKMGL
jgi:hypothetical protein